MYSSIISKVRKEENGVYIWLVLIGMAGIYFKEHTAGIIGFAGLFLLFEIMIRLQAIIKIIAKDET